MLAAKGGCIAAPLGNESGKSFQNESGKSLASNKHMVEWEQFPSLTVVTHRANLVLKTSATLDFAAGLSPLCCTAQVRYVPVHGIGIQGH